jgi:GTPase SAR1 family protein
MTATAIGATRYVECSAKTGQGITGIFEEGVRAVFHQRGTTERHEKKDVGQFTNSLAEFLCFK